MKRITIKEAEERLGRSDSTCVGGCIGCGHELRQAKTEGMKSVMLDDSGHIHATDDDVPDWV